MSSLLSSNREMTRKPNCTVVGGTIGHITGPLVEVQVDEEADVLVENEEQDEQDGDWERD